MGGIEFEFFDSLKVSPDDDGIEGSTMALAMAVPISHMPIREIEESKRKEERCRLNLKDDII